MSAEDKELKQDNNSDAFTFEAMPDEIINDFLVEANEGLQKLELDFITLEKEPHNTDLLNNIFRVIHSIKGAASFIGYKNLEGVSHKAEDVLNKLRKSELTLTAPIMDALLSAVDVIKLLLKNVEENRKDTAVATEEVKNILENIIQNPEGAPAPDEATVEEKGAGSQAPAEENAQAPASQPADKQSPSDVVKAAPEAQPSAEQNSRSPIQSAREELRSVRISVEKLDALFNLIGELVLSRNRNIQLHRLLSRKYPDDDLINLDLTEAGSYLNHLTSEIQWAVMKTRMIPVSTVFNKFRRVVRDIAKNLGKEIELNIVGEDTEIDKNIIEGIGDPLTHLIRNSADHGLETPDERERSGKNRKGVIELQAYYEGNHVVVCIKDDGKGIDVNAVRSKAVEKGLISTVDADKLSKASLLNLIFAPGLSTSQKVSAVSGRGVGMDVVKTNIEKLRGQIIIDSDAGIGTNIIMKIPLTLAILDTLIVKTAGQRYAVPLSNVVETHRITYGQIELVRGSMVFRMRDELMPLVLLSEVFNLPHKYNDGADITIVVLKNGLLRMGLVVDKTAGQEEVVIKPLDCLDGITEPQGMSGATILGDGSITFILDVDALMKMSKAADRHLENETQEGKGVIQANINTINVVLVDNLGKEQYAIPARNIKEIDLIHGTDVEDIGGRLMIKYRGKIIPLTTLPNITGVPSREEFENYYMVILTDPARLEPHTDADNEVGLLVGRLLGIKKIQDTSVDTNKKALSGVTGSTIFNDRMTFILNIEEVLESTMLR